MPTFDIFNSIEEATGVVEMNVHEDLNGKARFGTVNPLAFNSTQ